jgi:hypothetical protein
MNSTHLFLNKNDMQKEIIKALNQLWEKYGSRVIYKNITDLVAMLPSNLKFHPDDFYNALRSLEKEGKVMVDRTNIFDKVFSSNWPINPNYISKK